LNLEFANAHMLVDLKPQQTLAHLASLDPAQIDDAALSRLLVQDRSGVQVLLSCDAPENAELVTVPLVQHGIDHLRATTDYVIASWPRGPTAAPIWSRPAMRSSRCSRAR